MVDDRYNACMSFPLDINWEQLRAVAGPYPDEAFEFVSEGLGYTVDRIHEERTNAEFEWVMSVGNHVSGQELCIGLRDFAIKQYGLLAPTVLRRWNVNRTADFGHIVFAMIECGLMSKNESDSIEDFDGIFDFHEAFAREEILSALSQN